MRMCENKIEINSVYVNIYIYICVCICMCVRERKYVHIGGFKYLA
jgi:hypothetical protein